MESNVKKTLWSLVVVLILSSALAAKEPYKANDSILFEVPQAAKVMDVSTNGTNVSCCYTLETDGVLSTKVDYYLCVDGQTFGPFDMVSTIMKGDYDAPSSDAELRSVSKRLTDNYHQTYCVYFAEKDKSRFLFDGTSQREIDESIDNVIYLGNHKLLYKVSKDGRYYINDNARSLGPFKNVKWYKNGSDGDKIAILGTNDEGDTLYYENTVIGPYSSISNIQFSNDSKILSYVIDDENRGSYICAGTERLGPYEEIGQASFSADSKVLAFWYRINDSWYIQRKTTTFGPFVGDGLLIFNSDNSTIAYSVEQQNTTSVYVNDTLIVTCEDIIDVSFIPNTHDIAYISGSDYNWQINVSNDKYGPFMHVSSLDFLPNTNEVIFASIGNGELLHIGKNAHKIPVGVKPDYTHFIDSQFYDVFLAIANTVHTKDGRAVSYGTPSNSFVIMNDRTYIGTIFNDSIYFSENNQIKKR